MAEVKSTLKSIEALVRQIANGLSNSKPMGPTPTPPPPPPPPPGPAKIRPSAPVGHDMLLDELKTKLSKGSTPSQIKALVESGNSSKENHPSNENHPPKLKHVEDFQKVKFKRALVSTITDDKQKKWQK